MTGRQIREVLEQGLTLERGLIQVSGLTGTYDLGRPPGSRLLSAEVGGRPLDDARTYRVATNSFLAQGGDLYTTFLQAKKVADTGVLLPEIVAENRSARPARVEPPAGGRFVPRPSAPYGARRGRDALEGRPVRQVPVRRVRRGGRPLVRVHDDGGRERPRRRPPPKRAARGRTRSASTPARASSPARSSSSTGRNGCASSGTGRETGGVGGLLADVAERRVGTGDEDFFEGFGRLASRRGARLLGSHLGRVGGRSRRAGSPSRSSRRTAPAWSAPAACRATGTDRRPALAAPPDGGVWLAWDSTRTGNFDVFLVARPRGRARRRRASTRRSPSRPTPRSTTRRPSPARRTERSGSPGTRCAATRRTSSAPTATRATRSSASTRTASSPPPGHRAGRAARARSASG